RIGAAAVVHESLGAVEQPDQGRPRHALQGQQVAQAAVGGGLQGHALASGSAASGSTTVASPGAASQRSTMTAAATASSAGASGRRRGPAGRRTAKRCAASIELDRSSTITTGIA